MNDYLDYLEHHGIKGQKWGVRRFQNEDGTRTSAGKKRERISGKKIATGLAIAGVAALTIGALSNKNVRDKLVQIATSEKTKEFVKRNGDKVLKELGGSVSKAGKAMTEAALVSIGTIEISKLSKRLATNENDSESTKNRNKVILDTATAGINSITKSVTGSSNNSGKSTSGGNVGEAVSNRIGEPSKKGIDKSSSDYQNLFKDANGNQRDSDTRSTIKSLASNGYDLDQIKQYLNDIDSGVIKHSIDDYVFMEACSIGKNYIENIM